MKLEEEKVINKRIFGYVIGFFAILLLSLLFFWLEEKGMGITLVIFALIQIAFILITPKCYIFSRERLIIKYFFGLEENIPWQDIKVITGHLDKPGLLFALESYRLYYYSEKKQKFFMRGEVVKNKKTKALLKKYCTKKYNW